MDFVTERAKNKYSDEPADERDRKRRLLLQEAEMWGAFVGGAIQRQSLKFFWLEECIEGENPFIADTYKKILEAISEPAIRSSTLSLNTEVHAIRTERDDNSVEVVTGNGDRELYDEVVVTLPLGFLKRHSDFFSPPLPSRLNKAIEAIGYGCLDKVMAFRYRLYFDRLTYLDRSTSTFQRLFGIKLPLQIIYSKPKLTKRAPILDQWSLLITILPNPHQKQPASGILVSCTGYTQHTQNI